MFGRNVGAIGRQVALFFEEAHQQRYARRLQCLLYAQLFGVFAAGLSDEHHNIGARNLCGCIQPHTQSRAIGRQVVLAVAAIHERGEIFGKGRVLAGEDDEKWLLCRIPGGPHVYFAQHVQNAAERPKRR